MLDELREDAQEKASEKVEVTEEIRRASRGDRLYGLSRGRSPRRMSGTTATKSCVV